MSTPRLTEASFIVLGLLEAGGEEATPYDIKRLAGLSAFHFWSIPHTQIYIECERLAKAELLTERREPSGRRRRFYRLTDEGRKALEHWRDDPTEELYELRDPSLLKLFCGGDPAALADSQIHAHRRKLGELEELANDPDMPEGMQPIVDFGVEQERAFLDFWSSLLSSEA